MRAITRLAYLSVIVVILSAGANAADEPLSALWSKFEATRHGTANLHQEFEVTERVGGLISSSSQREIVLDFFQNKWREQLTDTSYVTLLFDGQDLFSFKADRTEYIRTKGRDYKDERLLNVPLDWGKNDPLPEPYAPLDWGRAKEVERLPCGLSGRDHTCIVIEAPVKAWFSVDIPGGITSATSWVMIDAETGVWLRSRMVASVGTSVSIDAIELTYTPKQTSYGTAASMTFFKVPDGLHEVKTFTHWDAVQINKQLAGKPAPYLKVIDIDGNSISLADLRGKAVLLDFLVTSFLPYEDDASSIEWLSQKYSKDLQVIGISMGEDREAVEQYLKKHPRNFPIVLSSENPLPPPYQIYGVLPTYLVIAPDGTLVTAEQGDESFRRLQKVLVKFGMHKD